MDMLRPPLPNAWGFGITCDNVNEALPLGLDLVKSHGRPFWSRGKETLEVPGPVSTVYRNPTRRVLFDEERDANPFFHLMESLWIIAGSNRVELPKFFLGSITNFSDDGKTFHGAYGYRLRHWPDTEMSVRGETTDQIDQVINLLRDKPDTRQAVLSIWNPHLDLGATTKDTPCNDMIMLQVRDGYLHMTVNNRSNDVIWGAYGANAVQFSMLQEFIAVMVGVEVGYYTQQSNSYHVYPDNPFWQKYIAGNHDSGHVHNPYMTEEVQPWPIALTPQEAGQFYSDCRDLDSSAQVGTLGSRHTRPSWRSPFFRQNVEMALEGYTLFKEGDYEKSMLFLQNMSAPDWRLAMVQWVLRRQERAALKGGAL